MDLFTILSPKLDQRFPHTRGDGPYDGDLEFSDEMFSPHTWGWTLLEPNFRTCKQVFPTHVGMDLRVNGIEISVHSFPHTRGDGPMPEPPCYTERTFSPHTWGWTRTRAGTRANVPVFPTHVGMDLLSSASSKTFLCFPHTRGDGPDVFAKMSVNTGFSPHTWGWTGGKMRGLQRRKVFPTHVGMDLSI